MDVSNSYSVAYLSIVLVFIIVIPTELLIIYNIVCHIVFCHQIKAPIRPTTFAEQRARKLN